MERLLNTILLNSSSLVVVMDDQGTLEYASPSVKETLGYEPNDITGRNWWATTRETEEEVKIVSSSIAEFMRSDMEKLNLYEQKLRSKWGSDKYILWDAIKMEDNKLVGIGRDITLQKQADLELQRANEELNMVVTDLKDSLNYAGKLQQAILKNPDVLSNCFSESFILYKPKEDISGDFYWIYETDEFMFVALVDCTGHGAPGALLSVITNGLLKELIVKKAMIDPEQILQELDTEFVEYLHENLTEGSIQDGMDIALIRYNKNDQSLSYSSANRPILIRRGFEFIELKASKYPIGFQYDRVKYFDRGDVELKQGDEIFLFSDGYADQFGGDRGKKFNRKRFKQTLLDIKDLNGAKKRDYLDYTIKNWMQNEEQIDDVTVIGLSVA